MTTVTINTQSRRQIPPANPLLAAALASVSRRMQSDMMKTTASLYSVAEHTKQAVLTAESLGDMMRSIHDQLEQLNDTPMEIVRYTFAQKGKPHVMGNTVILMHPDDVEDLIDQADLCHVAEPGSTNQWRGLPIRDRISKAAARRLELSSTAWNIAGPFD